MHDQYLTAKLAFAIVFRINRDINYSKIKRFARGYNFLFLFSYKTKQCIRVIVVHRIVYTIISDCFTQFVCLFLLQTSEKCTKIYNASAQLLLCSLSPLCFVAVVDFFWFCLSPP